ncbi:hypothetical protein HWV62_15349 [Athelia sp. TMB]|nr:hypothetical protein HWV62_15349 [Athelia sp. TMB]
MSVIETYQNADNLENDPSSIAEQSVGESAETPRKKQIRATTTWHNRVQEQKYPRSLVDWVSAFDLGPPELYEPLADKIDRGPVPYHPVWRENLFILKFMLSSRFYKAYFSVGIKLESAIAIGIQYTAYQIWFVTFAIHTVLRAHRFMGEYGTLNEHKRGRDIVPDVHYKRLHYALMIFIFVRNIGVFVLGKDRALKPSLSLWSPVKVGLFQIALDYFFYFYHRSTHEFDSLWFIHRQHHATKSPTPFMSLWADDYQDMIEWIIVPFLAYLVVNLTFAELYVASGYTLYVEAMGHSGIRAYWLHPLLGKVLQPFGMELAIEDHDLHHRHGRGGKNYGKQSRVWDVLFGTCAPREEEGIYASSKGQ